MKLGQILAIGLIIFSVGFIIFGYMDYQDNKCVQEKFIEKEEEEGNLYISRVPVGATDEKDKEYYIEGNWVKVCSN